jgi:hypothetical protein
LDEVAIYGNGLSAREVKALYDYQVAWFDVKEEHLITIDADKPTVLLGLQESHIKLQEQVMVITATNQTSNIASVQYRVDSGSWQTPTQNGQTWEFTYVPSSVGVKTIEVRATDGVGNTSSSSKSFTVDGTPPNVGRRARPCPLLWRRACPNEAGKCSIFRAL